MAARVHATTSPYRDQKTVKFTALRTLEELWMTKGNAKGRNVAIRLINLLPIQVSFCHLRKMKMNLKSKKKKTAQS